MRRRTPSRDGRRAEPTDISRGEYAYRRLLDAIRTGRLAPRRRLREVELAETLGISRTPIREALKRLEAEGLLVYQAPRGFIVNSVDQEELVELFAVLEVLEGTAARFAARHASDLELRRLDGLLADHARAIGDPVALVRTNVQFHRQICHSARNRYLASALASLGKVIALLGQTTYAVPGRGEAGLAEHTRIVEAIQQHDADAAEQAARDHVRQASVHRMQMLRTATE